MDHWKLSAALEAAAEAYAANRRLASHLPLEAAQIAFLAMESGGSDPGLKLCPKEENAGRAHFTRDEFDPASLDQFARTVSTAQRVDLAARLRRDIVTLKRYARTSDARYDINRHAALVRLLAVLDGMAIEGPHPSLNGHLKKKRRPAEAERPSKHRLKGQRSLKTRRNQRRVSYSLAEDLGSQ